LSETASWQTCIPDAGGAAGGRMMPALIVALSILLAVHLNTCPRPKPDSSAHTPQARPSPRGGLSPATSQRHRIALQSAYNCACMAKLVNRSDASHTCSQTHSHCMGGKDWALAHKQSADVARTCIIGQSLSSSGSRAPDAPQQLHVLAPGCCAPHHPAPPSTCEAVA
jgi:hypothetical protein